MGGCTQSQIFANRRLVPVFNALRGTAVVSASPQSFCPEEAPTTSLIMQLKSFYWAEQIFTAYFAANCFAWRKVLPSGLTSPACIHTFTRPITRGPHGTEQVSDKQAPRNERPCRHGDRCQQSKCVLGPATVLLCGPVTSVGDLRQPQIPALWHQRNLGALSHCWGGGARTAERTLCGDQPSKNQSHVHSAPVTSCHPQSRPGRWSLKEPVCGTSLKGPPVLSLLSESGWENTRRNLRKSRKKSRSLFHSLWTSSPSQVPFSPRGGSFQVVHWDGVS